MSCECIFVMLIFSSLKSPMSSKPDLNNIAWPLPLPLLLRCVSYCFILYSTVKFSGIYVSARRMISLCCKLRSDVILSNLFTRERVFKKLILVVFVSDSLSHDVGLLLMDTSCNLVISSNAFFMG